MRDRLCQGTDVATAARCVRACARLLTEKRRDWKMQVPSICKIEEKHVLIASTLSLPQVP